MDNSSTPLINQQGATTTPMYNEISKENIAVKFGFTLDGKETNRRRKIGKCRMNTRSFCITCWTTVSKDTILENIKSEFGLANISYICAAKELGKVSGMLHIHIQIILKRAVKKTTWFMDKYTNTHYNYQVTKNNLTWRKYIQKDSDFIEHGNFDDKSDAESTSQGTPAIASTIRIAGATVNTWIRGNFRNPNCPKCLVLIGLTGTGKTSFDMSLPGKAAYFKGRWSLSSWNDDARYLVFDEVPWDSFELLNFPNKKDLLSANGVVNVTDKYHPTVKINVTMPAIVLLNPGDEGSLLSPPISKKQQYDASCWAKRAFAYQMSDNEYFYREPATAFSSNINMLNRPLLGDPNEFEDMHQRWLIKFLLQQQQ